MASRNLRLPCLYYGKGDAKPLVWHYLVQRCQEHHEVPRPTSHVLRASTMYAAKKISLSVSVPAFHWESGRLESSEEHPGTASSSPPSKPGGGTAPRAQEGLPSRSIGSLSKAPASEATSGAANTLHSSWASWPRSADSKVKRRTAITGRWRFC